MPPSTCATARRKAWSALLPAGRPGDARPAGAGDRVERQMREAGQEVTIHALWVELADRAGDGGEPDVRAAAALAGVALGLRAG